MTEISIEATCFGCETEFDDSYDCETCSVCENEFCVDCQDEHAKKHCFENQDAIAKPEEKKRNKK